QTVRNEADGGKRRVRFRKVLRSPVLAFRLKPEATPTLEGCATPIPDGWLPVPDGWLPASAGRLRAAFDVGISTIFCLLLFASLASAQMPDPRQMSGIPR